MKIHITVFLIIAMILLSGCTSPSPGIDDGKDKRACVQVITPAVSPTGECTEFPTPCDVPDGWSVVESCTSSGSGGKVPINPGNDPGKDKRMCAQVITPAVSPTGECTEFPTPCDVPDGWSVVESCKSSTSDSTGKCCLVAKGICQRMVDGTSGCETGQPVDCGSIICNPQVV